MASEWVSYTLLQSREMVKRLLGRNSGVLSASAKEAGCSTAQLKLAMEKYMVLTEKERETMTVEEAGLFMLLRAEGSKLEHDQGACGLLRSGCSCGGSCECGGTCSGECSGNCNCGNCSGECGREN